MSDVEFPNVLPHIKRAARVKATGILQMISQLFQEKMVREQEVLLSSCSELKKKTLQEKK